MERLLSSHSHLGHPRKHVRAIIERKKHLKIEQIANWLFPESESNLSAFHLFLFRCLLALVVNYLLKQINLNFMHRKIVKGALLDEKGTQMCEFGINNEKGCERVKVPEQEKCKFENMAKIGGRVTIAYLMEIVIGLCMKC